MLQSANGMSKGWITAIISLLVIIADVTTKEIIVSSVSLYERINVLPFLNIVHVQILIHLEHANLMWNAKQNLNPLRR